jgi:hypothetical protein
MFIPKADFCRRTGKKRVADFYGALASPLVIILKILFQLHQE